MDRRTIALGVAAAGAVTAAVIVTVTGQSGGPSKEHKSVSRYIEQVDALEQQMQVPLTHALRAYRTFSLTASSSVREQRSLADADQALRALHRRVAALAAPSAARRLHGMLLSLLGSEQSLAHELYGVSMFTPRFNVLVQETRAASAALGKALRAASPPAPHRIRGTQKQLEAARAAFSAAAGKAAAQQADALDAYDFRLRGVVDRLRALDPPPVMAPVHQTQIRTLQRVRVAGSALAAELRKQNRPQVAVLGRRFTEAARTAGSVRAQTAQIDAIKSYNRRVQGIAALQRRVVNEVTRLQAAVG
jgi:ribosomal protein S30